MMAVVKREAENPASIRHPAHRIGGGIPVIEITRHAHLPGGRREAGKVHFVERPLRRITIRQPELMEINKHTVVVMTNAVAGWSWAVRPRPA